MRAVILPIAVLLMIPVSSVLAGDQDVLTQEFSRLEREFGGHLGVAAKNFGTGEIIAYNASERFPTASVVKLPIMAAVFHRIDLKLIDPTIRFTLTKEDKKPGSGILQFLSDSTTISLLDAVKLMIMLSDNTATNLVLDRIATTHDARMAAVNNFLAVKGLKNTRVLNRLYSWETKQQTPEGIRYGIGVSTPEDMVLLLDALYHRTLVDSTSCTTMLDILKQQQYNEMIPRLLPVDECKYLEVAHKTGEINETKVDVGLILSDKVNIALAVFVDKHPDHREGQCCSSLT
jgi:beta-lactamase class A